MISKINIAIANLVLCFVRTVLTDDSTNNKKTKGVFTNIRMWLLGIIIILGVIELLLVLYFIWKYLKKRKIKEVEGSNISVKAINQNSLVTEVNDKNEIDRTLLVNSKSKSTSGETITKHDNGSVSSKEDMSTTINSAHEKYSSSEVSRYTDSTDTSSEYKHNSVESKEDMEFVSNDSFSEAKTDVGEAYESSIDTPDEVKTEKSQKSFSSQQEKIQVMENDQISDISDDSIGKEGQNIESIKEATENIKEVITGANNGSRFQEQMTGKMNISNNLQTKMPISPIRKEDSAEEDTMETVSISNNEKEVSTTDSSSIEKEVATEVNFVEEKNTSRNFSENSTLNIDISETTTSLETSSDEQKEQITTTKTKLDSSEYSYSVPVQAKKGKVGENRRTRRPSRIYSKVWRKTRENLDIDSSED